MPLNAQTQHLFVAIVSWTGMHENAVQVYEAVKTVAPNVFIIYSDSGPIEPFGSFHNTIRRPDHLLWEDKFQTCLKHCGDNWLLVIHADCHCERWDVVAKRCLKVISEIQTLGVWAPKIEGTFYNLSATALVSKKDSPIHLVALTDAIVFSLSPEIVERMRRLTFGHNPHGWGIDLLFCSSAHAQNKLVVIDEHVEVQHPKARGYETAEAERGMQRFLSQFSMRERMMCTLLRTYVHSKHMAQKLR